MQRKECYSKDVCVSKIYKIVGQPQAHKWITRPLFIFETRTYISISSRILYILAKFRRADPFFEITLKRNRFEIPSSRWDISCYSSNFNYFIHSILFISCHLHCFWLVNEGSPDWSNDPNGHLRFTWRFGIWFYLVQIKCSYFYQFSQRKSSNSTMTSS